MMNKTAITTLDDLLKWWQVDEERPYWTLYRGLRYNKSDIIARNDSISDPAQAWDVLQEMISINSAEGGEFTVLRSDKPKGNYGIKAAVILSSSPATAHVAGVPGMPFIGSGPEAFKSYIAEQIAAEKKAWDLERKVEDLEAAIQSQQEGGFWDRILGRIAEHDKLDNIVDVLLARVLGGGQAQPSQVSVSGLPHDVPTAGQASADPGQFQYDTERVLHALERIRAQFPDDIHETLEALAAFVEGNPAMAQSLLQQLKR